MKLTRNALKEMIREILDEVSAASAASGKAKSAGKRGSAGKVDPGGNTVMRKRSHKRRRKIRKPVKGLR